MRHNVSVQLYINTLHNRVMLEENCTWRIRPILYVSPNMTSARDDALLTTAVLLGWTVLPAPRVNHIGLPFFKEMYFETERRFPNCIFYGFANGDILFSDELTQTLQAVALVRKNLVFNRIVNILLYAISPALMRLFCLQGVASFVLALFMAALSSRCGHYILKPWFLSYLWPPYVTAHAIIFSSCGFFLSFFLAYSQPSQIECLPCFHT